MRCFALTNTNLVYCRVPDDAYLHVSHHEEHGCPQGCGRLACELIIPGPATTSLRSSSSSSISSSSISSSSSGSSSISSSSS